MTRILVYEWCASGAARENSPRAASLWAEGWAMLVTAVADFRRVAGVEVQTILDAELQKEPTITATVADWPDVNVIWTEDEPAAFQAAVGDVDFALIIAPEFDRILETRCCWALDAGATLLGPAPAAVALTADKLALARHLDSHGVPTPPTSPAIQGLVGIGRPPSVVKPRFGAGSQATFMVTGGSFPDSRLGEMIVQPFIPGQPASVAFLIGTRQTIELIPVWQDISDDGRLHYRGGSAPLQPDLADRATRIARKAITAVSGLSGYVGVDVILANEGDQIIEVNPRLTTSYVGVRALTDANLMNLLIRLANGDEVAEPRWRLGSVTWNADGKCTTNLAPA
jgi:predicted ATP-grasp superfamily ATP-dependent carboligase